MARVFAAMSGGVDSSVAAALLVEAGHEVTGVTMRLLDEEEPGGCCPSGSVRDARLVCEQLGIPHYTWDMREVFRRECVDAFVAEYAAGRTPNPCLTCNEKVKFAALLERARREGGEALATGHYARVVDGGDGPRLARGADRAKDQSYFLYRTTPDQLARAIFPVGELTKGEVRDTARRLGLRTAEARESQDVCFVADGQAKRFVRERAPEADRGARLLDASGRELGEVPSMLGLTVGERLSPGGGPGGRRYVTAIDRAAGTVTVGPRESLDARAVRASSPVWWGAEGSEVAGVTARVRHAGEEVPAHARLAAGELLVEFERPVWAPAPGQAVVCWAGDIVIGGGVIEGAA